MEMPRPGAQHAALERLAGTWNGEETMHPSPWAPEGLQATSRIVAAMRLGGLFLMSDYQQFQDGKVAFEGHGVYGWDGRQQHYSMYWFDTIGTDPGPPATGVWDGDRLAFQHQNPMGHARYLYEMLADDHYRFCIEMSQDGEQWSSMMNAEYRREA